MAISARGTIVRPKKDAKYDFPLIPCCYCSQGFPGAIYDDQPKECCYDCYDKKIGKYPDLWKRLRFLLNSTPEVMPHSMIEILETLEQEHFLTLNRKQR